MKASNKGDSVDKQGDFKQKLTALKALLDKDPETVQLFHKACDRCNWLTEREKLSHNDWRFKDQLIDASMPSDLNDVITMMERRNDSYAGKTFLLFNEKAKHIESMRKVVGRIQEVFAKDTKEHALAADIGNALENVIAAAKPFQNIAKLDLSTDAQVTGIQSGLMAREYGHWESEAGDGGFTKHYFKGNAVIELKIEDLHTLQQQEAILPYAGIVGTRRETNGVDMRVVLRDGSVHSFNWKAPGERHFNQDVTTKFFEAVAPAKLKQDRALTAKDYAEAEENLTKLVMKLEKKHPPLVEKFEKEHEFKPKKNDGSRINRDKGQGKDLT